MRRFVTALACMSVGACGVFGTADVPADDAQMMPPPGTPQDNAKSPSMSVGDPAPPGIYVSFSKGADDGSGTEGRPLKTLKAALATAKAQGLRVVACAEEFPENVTALDGVSAFGYYDCSTSPWKRLATKRAIIRAPESPALLVRGITLPTHFEGFEVRAPDLGATAATETTGSSIALEVHDSKEFVMIEALLHGGTGAFGGDGDPGKDNPKTGGGGGDAFDQNYRTCNQSANACVSKTVPGPLGGKATCALGGNANPGGDAGYGQWWIGGSTQSAALFDYRGRVFLANAATAVGGLNDAADGNGRGLPGADGAQGADGADGANGKWSLGATGFIRGNGTGGGPGALGQGGGGGGGARNGFNSQGQTVSVPADAAYYSTVTGASGGSGGCPGQAGTPATGGAASIGALVLDSSVRFERVRIETAAGGKAGKGELGTSGTLGGAGGLPITRGGVLGVAISGKGGQGGAGGNGGASGHGAPGPSIALAFSKSRPTMVETELKPGPAGEGQPELVQTFLVGGILTPKKLPAVTGESMNEYQIP